MQKAPSSQPLVAEAVSGKLATSSLLAQSADRQAGNFGSALERNRLIRVFQFINPHCPL
jgi:hypothetical protein